MNRRNFIHACGISIASSCLLNQQLLATEAPLSSKCKPIIGSWFEFNHHNPAEGKYWDPALRSFTSAQWREKIREIREAGMEYLVLLSVADKGKTFYPSQLQPRHDFECPDPLEAVLSAADEFGVKFFVSNDFWGDSGDMYKLMTSKEVVSIREKGMEEVSEKYGHHPSFYGWYYPNETGLSENIDEATIHYVNSCSRKARELMPRCVNLIAPYGTKFVKADANFARQLERLDIDIIAYQDEVGVLKTDAGSAGRYFEALQKVHANVGRARLWADVEVFQFEGPVYKSALLPASFQRIRTQLEDVSPYVENILIYQYIGMMNKPGTTAFAGHPTSTELYTDYIDWLNKNK